MVEPVMYQGMRYEALHWGRERGLGQNGGYLRLVDEASGKEVRLLRVYAISNPRGMESDKVDRFIRKLTLDGDNLLIEDERGGCYRVDLKTLEVTPR